ncbi:hypothetical protein [Thermanaeromonas sp. C210]|uniref:hypothetical protein n=1 Tax=Thermanaeromonas sp. C210 TaxID=2731925 RepID=UPI00155BA17E|nr:hypothetical protein [Thermanaeromonas sp. C210]GFN21941.1 hypothetical protein TAMC210_02570 [Thermanaeromonas sp. C210]
MVEDLKGQIAEIVRAAGREGVTAAEVAARVEEGARPGASEATVRRQLARLVEEGEVVARWGPPPAGGGRRARLYVASEYAERGDVVRPTPREAVEREFGVLGQVAWDAARDADLLRAAAAVAPRLLRESPRTLLAEMAEWAAEEMRRSRRELLRADGVERRRRARARWELLRTFVERYFRQVFGVDRRVFRATDPSDPAFADPSAPDDRFVSLDRSALNAVLRERVYGDAVIELMAPEGNVDATAATDASVFDIATSPLYGPAALGGLAVLTATAAALVDFNTARAFHDYDVDPDRLLAYDEDSAAVEGLLLPPRWAAVLGESRWRHTRAVAMDLRHYLHDERVMRGTARWQAHPDTGLPPEPGVVFRNGRILPIDHKINDYEDDTFYGEMVRRNLKAFYAVFLWVAGTGARPVYAGVVKSPELPYLSPLVLWYARFKAGREEVEEEAVLRLGCVDTALAGPLLAAARQAAGAGGAVPVTFRALRRFADISGLGMPPLLETEDGGVRPLDYKSMQDWDVLFVQREARRRRDALYEGARRPLTQDQYTVFKELCKRIGVLMFFALPAQAPPDAPFSLPRLEVLPPAVDFEALGGPGEAGERKLVARVLAALARPGAVETDATGDLWSALPRIVPTAVKEAHVAASFTAREYGRSVEAKVLQIVAEIKRRYGSGK